MTVLHTASRHDQLGAWSAHHDWSEDSTSIDGQFADGSQVDLATWRDEDHAAYRTQAWHEWLHGRILVVTDPATDTPPVLVIPLDRINADAVNVALTAYAYGRTTEVTA